MPKSLTVASLVILAVISYSQGLHRSTRVSFEDSLGTLARAETLTRLESLWENNPHDFPHRAVHAAMISKLGGSNPDAVLISAMPTTGKEMQALYDAQVTKQRQAM